MKTVAILLVALASLVLVYSQSCPRCLPHCFNADGTPKICGDDGCGGSCGTCPFGQECCRGTCTCAPNCAGRQCGDDGCGGNSCGSCADGQTCNGGVCVGTGVRTCGNRVCGHDRMGGSCGACQPGQRCRGGVCECYNACDGRNCGTPPSEPGSVCPQTSCGTCPNGYSCSTSGLCYQSLPCDIPVIVRDGITNITVSSSCSVAITGSASYSATLNWTPPQTVWNVPGFGGFSFVTTCPNYEVSTENREVTVTTTEVILYVRPRPIPVDIREGGSTTSYTGSCSVEASGPDFYFSSFQWTASAGVTFTGHFEYGYGTYAFTANCPGYPSSETSVNIQITTTIIIIYITAPEIVIEVREKYGAQNLIGVAAQIAMSSGTTTANYNWVPNQVNKWKPPVYASWLFQTQAAGYRSDSSTFEVTSSISIIIVYLGRCGDEICNDGETWDNCPADCAALFLQFERYDANTPVNGFNVSFYNDNPRREGQWGPERNPSVQPAFYKTAVETSNVILESTFQHHQILYVEVVTRGYITFYWTVDFNHIDPAHNEMFELRGHLSPTLLSTDNNYRTVNTWRPADSLPEPYGPTDLNLHIFFPEGVCDISHATLTLSEGVKCRNIADAKQSAGPASFDYNLHPNEVITLWNGVPPRNPALARSQAGRFLKDSDSYVVFYGKASDASGGKQLGEVTVHDALDQSAARGMTVTSVHDIWRIADVSTAAPGQGALTINELAFFGTSRIDQVTKIMYWDCQLNRESFCVDFNVPYSDATARKNVPQELVDE